MLPLRSPAGRPPHDADDKDEKHVTKHGAKNCSHTRARSPATRREAGLFWLDFGSTWRDGGCAPGL